MPDPAIGPPFECPGSERFTLKQRCQVCGQRFARRTAPRHPAPATEPPSDSLAELRRTVYRMRYWCLLPAMVATVMMAAVSAHRGYNAGLPGLMISAGALGASWTVTGWLRDE